ncbi:hypothetical protein DL98DRAFT_589057 [Cadophora sp. DSE1049]|nr:hypothetical protein DL98DRAFT_589057 [Cadophora sp. DSE1049]
MSTNSSNDVTFGGLVDSPADLDMEENPEVVAQGPETFTCFPDLPLELRTKITKTACFEPRVIDLWAIGIDTVIGEPDVEEESLDEFFSWPFAYHSHAQRAPSILHASRELRGIGLKYYSLTFGTSFNRKLGLANLKITTPARIYVNWECDIILRLPVHPRDRPTHDAYFDGFHSSEPDSNQYAIAREQAGKYPEMRRLAIDASASMQSLCIFNNRDLDELIVYQPIHHLPGKMFDVWNASFDVTKKVEFEFSSTNSADPTSHESMLEVVEELDHAKERVLAYVEMMKIMQGSHGCRVLPAEWKDPIVAMMVLQARGREEASDL